MELLKRRMRGVQEWNWSWRKLRRCCNGVEGLLSMFILVLGVGRRVARNREREVRGRLVLNQGTRNNFERVDAE
jgi:hypothetical protein